MRKLTIPLMAVSGLLFFLVVACDIGPGCYGWQDAKDEGHPWFIEVNNGTNRDITITVEPFIFRSDNSGITIPYGSTTVETIVPGTVKMHAVTELDNYVKDHPENLGDSFKMSIDGLERGPVRFLGCPRSALPAEAGDFEGTELLYTNCRLALSTGILFYSKNGGINPGHPFPSLKIAINEDETVTWEIVPQGAKDFPDPPPPGTE